MNEITAILYSDGSQECERLASLLQNLGGEYLEYKLGRDFSERQFVNEFGKDAQYPQVTINYEHIGSLKDTLRFFQKCGVI